MRLSTCWRSRLSAHADASNYRRWLDLDTATASVRHDHMATYLREVFASYGQVIVIRLTASQPGSITFNYASSRMSRTLSAVGTDLVLHANVASAAGGLTSSVNSKRVRS
jgi:hypothetical protein